MKINFDDIITKANARKDALIEFGKWAEQLPDMLDQLDALKMDLTKMDAAARALDGEAVALVGEENVRAVLTFCGQVNYAHMMVFNRQDKHREVAATILRRLAEG